MRVWGPPMTAAPGFSYSHASPHSVSSNSSKLPFKYSYQFLPPVASASGKQISVAVFLWMCLSLHILSGGLP